MTPGYTWKVILNKVTLRRLMHRVKYEKKESQERFEWVWWLSPELAQLVYSEFCVILFVSILIKFISHSNTTLYASLCDKQKMR